MSQRYHLPVNPEFWALLGESGQPVERLRLCAELLEARVRRRAAVLLAWPNVLGEIKLLRPLDRQQLKQHRV